MRAEEILAKLIAFDSVSSRSNLSVIDWIADYLSGQGIQAEIVKAPDGQPKANLWASIGPDRDGGIVLSGHTDVVPVEGQPWSSDPFVLRDGGDRWFGRGTSDMKGFIALCLALVPEMKRRALKTPLHFAFSYDEEIGCLGAPNLIAEIGKRFKKPRIAIIGEPTELKLGTRHKGCYSFTTTITGKDGHSSQPERGLNAILAAAEVATELGRIYDRLRHDGPFDKSFDPPHSTINLGRINGGTAVNIIARSCSIEWDFRGVPGARPAIVLDALRRFVDQDLLPRLRAVAPEASIVTTDRVAVPPLVEEHDGAAETLMRLLTGQNDSFGMSFATEAGQFQSAGLSAIVCGPGSIREAHQPDEFILKEQLAAGAALLRRVIDWAEQN
ncbi:acetylornithine deacetylase [Dongia sp.]|uniref:acetylornithine deacetylase n=1 Tax=Dongia sp. TaxID=1977262 RepID=UPI003750D04E